jgi:hypothetical protein
MRHPQINRPDRFSFHHYHKPSYCVVGPSSLRTKENENAQPADLFVVLLDFGMEGKAAQAAQNREKSKDARDCHRPIGAGWFFRLLAR